MRRLLPILALAACPTPEPEVLEGPYGLPLTTDGVIYAGAAVVDLTPAIGEVFVDDDGDFTFDGCVDEPEGGTEDCEEGFVDADGDGIFEPVWIGGYGEKRPATEVRDGVSARAVVLAYDGAYVAFVVGDFVGLGHNRLDAAIARLEADGWAPERVVAGATHNHQGPDTLGLWGDPLAGVPGFDPDYQDAVVEGLARAVKEAAEAAVPVELRVGAERMRDRSVWFNGEAFGGKNPVRKVHGMVNDIRDPVVVSDQVLALHGETLDGDGVFTLTTWSGHPEVRGSDNGALSSDWVGVTREILEEQLGGIAVHFPESLGGMQSALGAEVPLVLDDGTHVLQTCDAEAVADEDDEDCFGEAEGSIRVDADGDEVPAWAEHDSWDFVTSHGWHIAEAAVDALVAGETITEPSITVDVQAGWVPVRNFAYNILGPQGVFDIPLDEAATDSDRCPAISDGILGCLPYRVLRAQVGPITYITAPGELVPELAWGFPDDPRFAIEAADPAERGPDSTYFPQHDPDCNDIDYADCANTDAVGDCDCLSLHAWPYTISPDPTHQPVLAPVTTKYKSALSATLQYLSYILPEPSVNPSVTLFSDRDGDHYEDTVTMGFDFGTVYLESAKAIDERW